MALGQLGDTDAVAALTELAADDESAQVRLAAATALASPKLKQTGFLIEQLAAEDAEIRAAACRALGHSEDPNTIDPLIGALGDAVAAVRT